MYERSVQKIMDKKFYSSLIDGATESSVITGNELIYVRYLNNGVLENHILNIVYIENILKCIDTAFNWKENLVGFNLVPMGHQ